MLVVEGVEITKFIVALRYENTLTILFLLFYFPATERLHVTPCIPLMLNQSLAKNIITSKEVKIKKGEGFFSVPLGTGVKAEESQKSKPIKG